MKKALLLALVLVSLSSPAQNVSFGKHSRIVKTNSSPEMATAAGILQRYLSEATGYPFPESNAPAAKRGDILLREIKDLPEDSFRISAEKGAVVLESTGQGLIYAACDFLEQEMGMDYWGDGEYFLPKGTEAQVRTRTEVPAFRYRQTSHYSLRNGKVATSDNGVDKEHRADDLYRHWYRLEEPHQLFVDNLWVHTCN